MNREARFLKNGSCYYIHSQSFKNRQIFKSNIDFEHYLNLLKKYKIRFESSVYGYCLLPSEIYLILHPSDSTKLPSFMQGIQQSYALYFNIQYKRSGKVWRQRYKSVAIYRDSDLFEYIKLIEFIPVKKGKASMPMQYDYSSCSTRILGFNKVVNSMPPRNPILSVL